MNLTMRVTRDTFGTLTEVLSGGEHPRNPYCYPKTLNRGLTGCAASSDEYGVFTVSDGPIKFFFSSSPQTAPVLVAFGDLEYPARLEPDCTPQRAEMWAREYLRVLVRRLNRVEESRRFQLPDFSVSVSVSTDI